MFVILLRFAAEKTLAQQHMDGHKAWIQRGLDDGILLLVGSLLPNAGGAILAHGVTRAEIEARVNRDPFVEHNVVQAEIIEIAPQRTDERLSFLGT
ncbi:MAG: hypothetical protein JJ864_05885 [Rhizobiaceae bacterium]|nr:hypothetical protein [Rhizobiaceae bacterium]